MRQLAMGKYSAYAISAILLLGAGPGFARLATALDESHARLAIPATATEIWRAVDTHIAALHAAVQMKKLAGVHVHAFAIRDLVRALPSRSSGMSAAALAKVKSTSGFVDTLATRLDKFGDAGDAQATATGLARLEGLLKQLRPLYKNGK